VVELSSVAGVTLDADERYTVRLLSVDGGAVLGTVVSRTLVLLASASPSGVLQLYFAGSRHQHTFTVLAKVAVMDKSRIESLTQVPYLLRNGFKSYSQFQIPQFSSSLEPFKVKSDIKSQIFHKSQYL